MADRCTRCQRKQRASGKATDPNLCHRTGSHECVAAERGFVRGTKTIEAHLRSVINAVCLDDNDGVLDSLGVDPIANALRHLAETGRVRIDVDDGANVVGRWV